MEKLSNLHALLSGGHFVVCAEVGPPDSADLSSVRKAARELRDCVDAVNVTDNQSARCHAASWAGSLVLLKEGLEPVLQLTTRDRNRLALQSDLLGAYGLGLRNVLCITGDHPTLGDHPKTRPSWDIDSMQFIRMVRELRDEGRLMNGARVDPPPRFFVGAAANPFAEPKRFRVLRLRKKQRAGADFIQTQPVFDMDTFRWWLQQARELGITEKTHILAGLMPVTSVRPLLYMRKNIPGVSVPDAFIDSLRKSADQRRAALGLAVEYLQELKELEGIHGIHIMPVSRESLVREVVEGARLLPRPSREGVIAEGVTP